MTTTLPKPALAISETAFQNQVVDLAHLFGYSVAHFRTSRTGSGGHGTAVAYDATGYPDLTICGPNGVIFAEVKAQKGHLTPAQEEWAGRLIAAGATWFMWKPSDWDAIVTALRPITPGVKR